MVEGKVGYQSRFYARALVSCVVDVFVDYIK